MNTITKTIAIVVFLTITLMSCTKERLTGSGTVVTEERNVAVFTAVSTEDVINANIMYGATQKVEVVTDDNLIQKVQTTVENGTLTLQLDDNKYKKVTTMKINITIPILEAVSSTDVGDIDINGFIDLPLLTINQSGVGVITASGSAQNLIIEKSGVGDFNAYNFTAQDCQINQSGVGNTEITCQNALSGSNSGVGDLKYKGNPSINISSSGVGSVINAN